MANKEFFISKLSFREDIHLIKDVTVYEYDGSILSEPDIHERQWMVNKTNQGLSFSTFTPNPEKKNNWIRGNQFTYSNGYYSWGVSLPENIVRRKTFVSYYHNDDQYYREKFENLFGDLIVGKSVEEGDIDSDNSDEYIKQLIQKDYLSDVTILVVLVGAKTKCRKHIDWEISGALNYKVGDNYAGLIGILLPTHPDYGPNKKFNPDNLPKRLAVNVESGYATLHDWSDDRATVQKWIEEAFSRRKSHENIVNKAIPQMQRNTCE